LNLLCPFLRDANIEKLSLPVLESDLVHSTEKPPREFHHRKGLHAWALGDEEALGEKTLRGLGWKERQRKAVVSEAAAT
jgi:hypothetical protein